MIDPRFRNGGKLLGDDLQPTTECCRLPAPATTKRDVIPAALDEPERSGKASGNNVIGDKGLRCDNSPRLPTAAFSMKWKRSSLVTCPVCSSRPKRFLQSAQAVAGEGELQVELVRELGAILLLGEADGKNPAAGATGLVR